MVLVLMAAPLVLTVAGTVGFARQRIAQLISEFSFRPDWPATTIMSPTSNRRSARYAPVRIERQH